MKNTFKASQFVKPSGMARGGGMMSKASTPNVNKGIGSAFAAMENTLLKGSSPSPQGLAPYKGGKQFLTKANDYLGKKKMSMEK